MTTFIRDNVNPRYLWFKGITNETGATVTFGFVADTNERIIKVKGEWEGFRQDSQFEKGWERARIVR